MQPLNGKKTHPLTTHEIAALVELSHGPQPRQTFNPGVVNRLLRGELVEWTFLPSPYKTHAGKNIEFLRLTKLGHEIALHSHLKPNDERSAAPEGSAGTRG